MSFEIDIEKFAEKTGRKIERVTKGIKIGLFNGVIRDTRVDTGRLRGNWQTTNEQPASGTLDRLDPSGVEAQREVTQNVTSFGVDYLTNNLPYAKKWDDEDGTIDKNMARIQRTVKEAVDNA